MGLVLWAASLGSPAPASAAGPVTATGTSFTFTGSGWGHGVGMSQYGARGMADAGRSHAQILTTYYSGASLQTRAVNDALRVLIASSRSTITLTASGPTEFVGVGTVGAGAKVTVTRSGSSLVLSGSLTRTVASPLRVRHSGNPLAVAETGYSYRYGELTVKTDSSGLRAIVGPLTMQEYLYGLGEMPSSWHTQALRAQAVAGRTFAQKKSAQRASQNLDYDLLSTTLDQAYTGTKFEADRWRTAVDLTAGQVMVHDGALIDAVYSSSSGGHTENSEYVWVANIAYLRGVPDPFEASSGNPYASWSRTYTGKQLGGWFGLGEVSSVSITGSFGASGRVDKATVRLVGTGGSLELSGATFRSRLNAASLTSQLMSTRFTVTATGSPPAVGNRPPTGAYGTAGASGSTITVTGRASDPDGIPTVRVVSTMGSQVAVRDRKPVNGSWSVSWSGAKGTRRVCVSVLDAPTGAATSLGCRDVVVK